MAKKKSAPKKKRAGVKVKTSAYKNGTKASGFFPFSGYSRKKKMSRKK